MKSNQDKMKTSKQMLLYSVITMTIFVLYTIIFYSIKGWQWDNLFPYILGGGITLGGTSGVLGIVDKVATAWGNSNSTKEEFPEQDTFEDLQ